MIKLCPFGTKVSDSTSCVQTVQGGFAVVCITCGSFGPTSPNPQSAVTAWNGGAPGNVNFNTPAVATQIVQPV